MRTDEFVLPPDKSILHRLLIIGSLTNALVTVLHSHSRLPEDVEATINCLEALGVVIKRVPEGLVVHGVGVGGWKTPIGSLDCFNSGTTARLLMGALSGEPITSTIVGDRSLSKRPMKRLATFLRDFGADITFNGDDGLPLTVSGKSLHPAVVDLPIASAQMKSALMLAALHTNGGSSIIEPFTSRNHTEIMLSAFGVAVQSRGNTIEIDAKGHIPLKGSVEYSVPSDTSAAYYLIAASILSGKPVLLRNVLLNPTRTRFLELLRDHFPKIIIDSQREEWGEIRGDIYVEPVFQGPLNIELSGEDIPLLIDELPLVAVLAAHFESRLVVKNAGELRYKESDRIKLIVNNLMSIGTSAEETDDGFIVEGKTSFIPKGTIINHGSDHRIAMSFALAAVRSNHEVTISDQSVVNVSFPGFFSELEKIIGKGRIIFR